MAAKDLLKYSETRFAYNFLMLERLIEVSQTLRQLVVSDEWAKWDTSTSAACVQCRADVLDDDFWESASYISSMVGPIIKLMRLVDGDEPCIGKVYEGMDKMVENIKNVISDEDEMQEMQELCIERWNSYHVPLHAAAYVLDPEFQGHRQERDKEVQRGWEATLRRMVPDADARREVKDQLAFYRTKQGLFGYEDAQRDRFKISSPLWWEEYGADTPSLRDIAVRILSQGASSSPCERLWSSFASIATKKRNRLGVEKASDLMFVNANLRLLQKVTGEFSREEYIGWTDPDKEAALSGQSEPEPELEADPEEDVGCSRARDIEPQ